MPELSEREEQIKANFNSQGNETLAGRMGIRIIEASRERVVGTMPVEGNTQPYGILHGGASCVLAESLGSLGSALQAGPGRYDGRHRDQRDAPPMRRGPGWSLVWRRSCTGVGRCPHSTS